MEKLSAWDRVTLARKKDRPSAKVYLEYIFDDFIEFHGDRLYGDDKAIMGGIATINGLSVTVIAQVKGDNTKENIERNFAMPHPEGYRKALRLMKQAEKFKRPVICFVDTPGAFCGIGAEERGQGEAIARNLMEMMTLRVPIISIVIGEGGSGGALALAVADEVWMMENSIYSILSPEGFASILWKDKNKTKDAAEAMKITSKDLKDFGIIERMIEEPNGGAHIDKDGAMKNLKEALIKALDCYNDKSEEELLERRYRRFRNMGMYE